MRNTLLAGLIIVLIAGHTVEQRAHASGIPVVDVANLAQAIIQVLNDVTKLANQATQITNQVNQINNQVEMLRDIGPSQFAALAGTLGQQTTELGSILSAASQVKYSLGSVQAQIDAAFPQNTDWNTFDMSTVTARMQTWDNVLTEANSLAMRAQASMRRIVTRNTQIQNLLSQATSATGQVRQLQINAQLNGQVAQALNDNAQVTATAARAQMLEHQRAVAERELGREQHARAMTNFADRGTPVAVLGSLPPIAAHP